MSISSILAPSERSPFQKKTALPGSHGAHLQPAGGHLRCKAREFFDLRLDKLLT